MAAAQEPVGKPEDWERAGGEERAASRQQVRHAVVIPATTPAMYGKPQRRAPCKTHQVRYLHSHVCMYARAQLVLTRLGPD